MGDVVDFTAGAEMRRQNKILEAVIEFCESQGFLDEPDDLSRLIKGLYGSMIASAVVSGGLEFALDVNKKAARILKKDGAEIAADMANGVFEFIPD